MIVGTIVGSLVGYGIGYTAILELQQQTSALTLEKMNLEDKISSLQSDKTDLQNQVNALSSEVLSLQNQISQKNTDIQSLQTEVDQLQNENTMLSTNITDLMEQIQLLDEEVNWLKNQISSQINVKTNIPPGFTLLSNNSHINILNQFILIGEMQYALSENVWFVRIDAAFFDSAGTLLDTDFTYTASDILVNGDKTPFKVSSKYGNKVASYVLSVTWEETTESPYRQFEVENVSTTTDTFGSLILNGQTKNTGSIQAKSVQMTVTFYDIQGRILDFGEVFPLPTDLDPNQVGTFEATLSAMWTSKYADYSVIVEV